MKRYTTIAVTVHNREKFLRQCLDSILAQTETDLDIVCVDDASTDSCPDILREYERKDSRVRLCLLEKNVGVQCARNKAVEMARGEYIIFVDDDDWLGSECVEQCLDSFKQYPDADCVLIPEKRVRTNGTVYEPEGRAQFDSITGEEAFLLSMPWHVSGCFCVRLEYQRQFLFDNSSRWFGDENTGRMMLLFARKVVQSKGVYYYRMHDNSICHNVGIGQYTRLQSQRCMAQELRRRKVKDTLLRAYETFCWENVIGAYMRYYVERRMMNKALQREAMALIKKAHQEMDYRMVRTSMKRKFGFMPLQHCWWLFRLQEEVYFTLRTLLGRMSIDMD